MSFGVVAWVHSARSAFRQHMVQSRYGGVVGARLTELSTALQLALARPRGMYEVLNLRVYTCHLRPMIRL